MMRYLLLFTTLCLLSTTGCMGQSCETLRAQCLDVLAHALEDTDPVVMTHAAETLIAVGKTEGLEARFEALLVLDEPDRAQRELQTILAARMLYRLGRHDAIERVVAILNDPDSPRRHTAAETIGKIRYRPALDDVWRAVTSEAAPARSTLWAYGVGALAKCGDVAAQRLMLAEGFTSTQWNVRRITANDLGEARLSAALPKLRAMVANEPDTLTRVAAAGALLHSGDTSGMQILRSAIEADRAIERKHASRAFRAASDVSVLPLLAPRLKDPDADVRVIAADAMLHVLAMDTGHHADTGTAHECATVSNRE